MDELRPQTYSNSITSIYATISDENSHVGPLAAGMEFTGQWVETLGYSSISFLLNVEHNGTLILEHSIDGNMVDRVAQLPIPAGAGWFSCIGPRSRLFRLRYVNGSVDSQWCRIQTTLSPMIGEHGAAPMSQGLSTNSVTNATRALMFGKGPNGYLPIAVDDGGNIIVSGGGTAGRGTNSVDGLYF